MTAPAAGTMLAAMTTFLRWQVRLLLPLAAAWVGWQERRILRRGEPLGEAALAVARQLGLRHPERIRLHRVDQLPGRLPAGLVRRLVRRGLLPADVAGMTLGYGILLRRDRAADLDLLGHELVHVRQYEALGGVRGFLRRYLAECLGAGYPAGDLEVEARTLGPALGRALSRAMTIDRAAGPDPGGQRPANSGP